MINTKNLIWLKPSAINIPDNIKSWLLDDSSLTAKLKQKYPNFSLKVLSQENKEPHKNEQLLNLKKIPLIREVLLLDNNKPLVFARSIIPNTKDTKVLHNIGAKPLGEILFNDDNISRSDVKVAKNGNIWGRRTVFTIGNTSVLVTEFFIHL